MKHFLFSPKILPSIILFLLFFTLCNLGIWQLHRAAEKEFLQVEFTARSSAKPLKPHDLKGDPTSWRYYQLEIRGHFDNAHSFLLDNKFFQHQVGYNVLTPFILAQNEGIVLINRGWIPLGKSRHELPFITPVVGEQVLRGIIAIPDKKTFSLSHEIESTGKWPLRIEQTDLNQISQLMGYPLKPLLLLLLLNQPHGFKRDWQPVTMKAYVHQGYAVQWFAMAAIVVIILIGINFKRRDVKRANEKT